MTERSCPCLSGGIDCEFPCPVKMVLPTAISEVAARYDLSYEDIAAKIRQKDSWAIRNLLKILAPDIQCIKEPGPTTNS